MLGCFHIATVRLTSGDFFYFFQIFRPFVESESASRLKQFQSLLGSQTREFLSSCKPDGISDHFASGLVLRQCEWEQHKHMWRIKGQWCDDFFSIWLWSSRPKRFLALLLGQSNTKICFFFMRFISFSFSSFQRLNLALKEEEEEEEIPSVCGATRACNANQKIRIRLHNWGFISSLRTREARWDELQRAAH